MLCCPITHSQTRPPSVTQSLRVFMNKNRRPVFNFTLMLYVKRVTQHLSHCYVKVRDWGLSLFISLFRLRWAIDVISDSSRGTISLDHSELAKKLAVGNSEDDKLSMSVESSQRKLHQALASPKKKGQGGMVRKSKKNKQNQKKGKIFFLQG